jgi:hypothetical protein
VVVLNEFTFLAEVRRAHVGRAKNGLADQDSLLQLSLQL